VDIAAEDHDTISLEDFMSTDSGSCQLAPSESFIPWITPRFKPGFTISDESKYMEPGAIMNRVKAEWASFESSQASTLTHTHSTLMWVRDCTNASGLKAFDFSASDYTKIKTIGRKLSNRHTAAKSKRKTSNSSFY
jgi:hypothetical protein